MTGGDPWGDLSSISPAELVTARCRAFDAGDFVFVYDSYHPDSFFIRQFPDREAYIAYARTRLARDYKILECRVLKERGGAEQAEVLFFLASLFRGVRQESFELSTLVRTAGGWRYHSSQKLSREDFSGELDAVDWSDFEAVGEKVFF